MGLTEAPAWGVLGGTFDPIHDAHLAIAEQTREALDLAGILFIPAGAPPHKSGRPITAAAHRVAMVELAIAGNPTFALSRIETDRPGASYTIDTLEGLGDAFGDVTLILSVEALHGLPAWREPMRILERCRLAVVPRRGYGSPDAAWLTANFPGREDRFVFLEGPDLGHSASDIRARAATARSIRYLVPDAVAEYIHTHELYTPASRASNQEENH